MSRAISKRLPRCRSRLLLLAVLIPWIVPGRQLAQQPTTFKVEAHLVENTFSVRDAQGRPVRDLTADDVTVLDDGIPQKIRFFARNADLPLSFGLLIDASDSQQKFLKQHERDIETFLHRAFGPGDKAFAVCFGNHLRLVSDFTESPAALVAGIHAFHKGSRNFPVLGPDESRDLGTALNDAVYFSIKERFPASGGRRRAIILFSDGEENSSEHDLLDALEAAQNADVLVYTIRYTAPPPKKMTARDRYGMRLLDHLSAQTGGQAYDASATSLDEAFAAIAEDLHSLYELAYQPTNTARDGTFHKVIVQTNDKQLTVRARSGYYAR